MVSVSGERKQLTVLFADVAGSMDLQEQMDAEVWAGIMGRFVAILAEGVRKFGGTVDKFTGDGIMALFGAPVAQEDHARRACHAAWHLTRSIGEYSEELRRERGLDLHVRLGLNSGEVVVGRVGDDVTLDPTALGHTVGLAQRMEATAEPGKAYLTVHTARLVEGWFGLEDLGPMSVKGSREQLRVYALAAPAPSPPVLHGPGLGVAPLVGRDREVSVLEDALAMAEDGRFQVVGVVGEAGVGKSRLCEEFAASAAARGITVRRTAGVSHGHDVPLLPVLALYRDYFGVIDSDRPEDAREKIAKRVLDLEPDLEESLPLLFDFLEVPDPSGPAPQLEPEVRMRRLFGAIRRLTTRRSERETLVLVVEDLHWFDPQSEAFLGRLIESFPGSRTLVVGNFRPEFSASWMRHSYCRQLPLAPLHDAAVGELLSGLLGAHSSLLPLLGFVQERTAGNPFFVEEVVRALIEDGTLVGFPGSYQLSRPLQHVKVSANVQTVLAARIDRLPAEQKSTLETAAVIGRTFSEPVLADVTGLAPERLDEILRGLCAAELIQAADREPAGTYRFWHPLTQEVAYSSLLSATRRRLHAKAAEVIITHEPDRLDERAALIANHFDKAGETLESARWEDRAAHWAIRSEFAEGARRWREAISRLDTLPETHEALALGVRMRTQLLRSGARTGMTPDETRALFEDASRLAERLADDTATVMLLHGWGTERLVRGDVAATFSSYVRAAQLALNTQDGTLQVIAALSAGAIHPWVGPLSEGFRWTDVVAAQSGGDPECGASYYGYSPLVRMHLARADLASLAGQLTYARTELDQAVQGARQRNEPEVVAWGLSLYPRLSDLNGDDDHDVLTAAAEAIGIVDETENLKIRPMVIGAHGVALLINGRPREAAVELERALSDGRRRHAGLMDEANLVAYLARAYLETGEPEAARRAADEAVDVARRQGARVFECHALVIRAHVRRLTAPDPRPVRIDLDDAARLVTETGAVSYLPFIHEELGRLHGDEHELSEAVRRYRQIGATGHACRLEAEVASRTGR